jgi:signal transduction histidine kinase
MYPGGYARTSFCRLMVVVHEPASAPYPVSAYSCDILVVDDDPRNLVAIEAAMGDLGRLVKARSGREALACLLKQDFALILLDVRMPDLDGFETARLIRGRERSRHVPIIFLTAYQHDLKGILEGYSLGAVDFLFKPITPLVLRAKASVFVTLQQRNQEVMRQAELLREAERRDHERQLADARTSWEAELLRRRVAEERRASEELTRLNAELRDAHRRKDEFLAMLAHELRNPLTPLHTSLAVLRTPTASVDTARLERMMSRQVLHLTRLVDDLLDVSRITSGKIELRREVADLRAVIDQAVAMSRPHFDERGHQLDVGAPVERLELFIDVVRVAQVISNLLHNAAKYTEPPGHVALRCRVEDEHVVVEVRDDGLGIPETMRERIFEPFVQVRPHSGGLGVGLALVRRLVELHDGTVTVASNAGGRGSTFTVRVPRSSEAAGHSRKTAAPSAPRDAPTERLLVVVVEDSADVRESLEELLEMWGHEVLGAGTGPDGVALILDRLPDVALVDIGLPGMDGCDVARKVRATPMKHQPRLVALTGYGQEADRARAREAGFDCHLVKPPDVDELQRALTQSPLAQPPP